MLDLAFMVALGGDAACDLGVLRAQPGLFGLVASDPTVSRLVTNLAQDAVNALAVPGRWRESGSGAGPGHPCRIAR